MNVLIVSPAYGRDYTSDQEARRDWFAGKDFRSHSMTVPGTYVSCRDIYPGMGIDQVNIRYDDMTQVAVIVPGELYDTTEGK